MFAVSLQNGHAQLIASSTPENVQTLKTFYSDLPTVARTHHSVDTRLDATDEFTETVKRLFEDSEVFTGKANFFWLDLQLLTNRGKREYLNKTVIPMVGLHYERQFWKNVGLRASLSTNWWQENRTLAQTTTEKFSQLFDYQYWTLSLGPTYHFNVNAKWDPFLGLFITARHSRAACPCYTLTETAVSADLAIGTRYFPAKNYFLMTELGQHGTGYVKVGAGFKF